MYTVKFISETACIMLMDGNDLLDYEFLNKFRFENNMMYRSEAQKEIDLLLRRNHINNYKHDDSLMELWKNTNVLTVKCHFADGDSFITDINLTPEEAKDYYLNRYFNIGSVEDNMQLCTRIEILN